MKRLITWTLAAVILMVLGGFAYAKVSNTPLSLLALLNPGQVRTVEVSGPLIIQAIQQQAKLSTVEITISEDKTITKNHGILDRCTEEITYLAYYQIAAGVDLEAISLANISEETDGTTKTIYITLPHAEILTSELDTANSRVVAESYPRWQPGCERHASEIVIEAQQAIRAEAEATALERGILADAENKTRTTLQEILGSAGIDDVQIRFGAVEEAE